VILFIDTFSVFLLFRIGNSYDQNPYQTNSLQQLYKAPCCGFEQLGGTKDLEGIGFILPPIPRGVGFTSAV
jgi:hypothetical protein